MSYKEHYYDDEGDWKEEDRQDRLVRGENISLSPGLHPFKCKQCLTPYYQNYLNEEGICFSCISMKNIKEMEKEFWNGMTERECVEFAKTINQ